LAQGSPSALLEVLRHQEPRIQLNLQLAKTHITATPTSRINMLAIAVVAALLFGKEAL
jgi:hypothetical protein